MQTVSSSCCHAAPRGCLKRNVTAPRSLPRAHLGGQEDRPSTVLVSPVLALPMELLPAASLICSNSVPGPLQVKASMVHWTAVAAALQLALLPAGHTKYAAAAVLDVCLLGTRELMCGHSMVLQELHWRS